MKLLDVTGSKPLHENPLGDYALIGNWGDKEESNSFRHPTDRRLLQSPKILDKVRKKLGNTDHYLNFYFVNLPGAGKYMETGPVTEDWLTKELPEAWEAIQKHRQENPRPEEEADAINLILTNNTGANRRMMTPWIMAHRLGHGMQSSTRGRSPSPYTAEHWNRMMDDVEDALRYIFEAAYGAKVPTYSWSNSIDWGSSTLARFFEHIGTMRSARKGDLKGRPYEFIYEAFAQYITEGRIRMNPIPKSFGMRGKRQYYVQDEHGELEANLALESMIYHMESRFDAALGSLEGKWVVM